MKEINAAYEQITRERASGRRSGSSGAYGGGASYGGYGGGYGSYGGYQSSQSYSGQASVLQQARIAINTGNISRAEALLANYPDHNAEWNFLRGAVCYRRGLDGRGPALLPHRSPDGPRATPSIGRPWTIWRERTTRRTTRAAPSERCAAGTPV